MRKHSLAKRRLGVSFRSIALAAAVWPAVRVCAQVTLDGSTLNYSADQNLGQLNAHSLGNSIYLSGTNRKLTFASLAPRGDGATLDFWGDTNGPASTFGVNQFVYLTGQAPGYIGPWLTVSGGNLAVYDPAVGLRAMAAGNDAVNEYATTITSGRHVRLLNTTPTVLTTSANIESLSLSGLEYNAAVSLSAGTTLTLKQGALMKSGYYDTPLSGGTIVSGADQLIIGVDRNDAISEFTLSSDLVVNAGGLVKTGFGTLNLASKITGPGNIYLRRGMTQMQGDRTGQGTGKTIYVEGGQLAYDQINSLGNYAVNLEHGGTLIVPDGSKYAGDLTIGTYQSGGSVISGNNVTLSGTITSRYQAGSSLSFGGNVTLGGGPTDTRPNDFSSHSLITLNTGTITFNKANGVEAYAGDLGLFGFAPGSSAPTLKWLADEQMSSTSVIGTALYATVNLNGHKQSLSSLLTDTQTEIKLGTGGQLIMVGQDIGGQAKGFISGAGKLIIRGTGQMFLGADTFSGGLVIESGSAGFQNARSISGGVTLKGGVFGMEADNNYGAVSNPINFDGGKWVAYSQTSSAHLVNVLDGGGVFDVGSSSFTINGAVGGTAGALHQRGTGQLILNSNLNFAGKVVADTGTVALSSVGRLLGQSGLQTSPSGTVLINSPTDAVAADQLADTSFLYAAGGTLTYVNNSAAGANETTGTLVRAGSHTDFGITNPKAGSVTLTIGTLAPRGGGATMNFNAPDLGNSNRFILPGQAEGFMGSWALANNAGFAKYSATAGVIPLDPADYATDFVADSHVRISANPAAPLDDLSVTSLTVAAPSTMTLTQNAGTTLAITSGGIFKSGVGSLSLAGGSLTADAGNELTIYGNGGDVTVSSAITGAIGLAKSGTGKLRLTGAAENDFSGTTYVNQGTLELAKSAGATALSGDVVINGGTLRLQGNEQIADSSTVTLNSGTFDLSGYHETVQNFANNGGTFLASGGRLTVLSEHTATFSSGATTIGSGQIIDATGLHIAGGANTVAAGGVINVFRVTPDGEVSGGLSLTGAEPAITVGSSFGTSGIIALGGEVTIDATGLAKISTDSPGASGGRIDLRGARVFNLKSDLEINARLINGTLIKQGIGLLRLNGSGNSADVSVDEGELEVTSVGGIGTGTAIVNGGGILLKVAGTAATFTGNIAVTKDGTVEVDRPTDSQMSGAATGDFSIGGLSMGAKVLNVIGHNGGSLKFTGASMLTGNATINAGLPVTLAGALAETGGSFAFTKTGAAPLVISGSAANTYTGTTMINSGDVELRKSAGANAIGGDLVIAAGVNVRSYASNQIANTSNVSIASGATLDLQGSSDVIASVNVAAGGTLRSGAGKLGATTAFNVAGTASITPGDSLGDVTVSGVATLGKYSNVNHAVLATSLVVTGQLDIADNNFVVDYTGASPLASIRSSIISGYGNAASRWKGPGISSSTAAADSSLAIGYAEASDILTLTGGSATYLNQPVDATTVLLRVTLAGDADLDGKVSFSDLVKVAQNYGKSGDGTWSGGDFDYDGSVGFSDLVTVAQHYGQSLSGLAGAPVGAFAADVQAAFASVPEPGIGGMIAIAGLALARRRRRNP